MLLTRAAEALKHFKTRQSADALFTALNDEDNLVQNQAVNALLFIAGIETLDTHPLASAILYGTPGEKSQALQKLQNLVNITLDG